MPRNGKTAKMETSVRGEWEKREDKQKQEKWTRELPSSVNVSSCLDFSRSSARRTFTGVTGDTEHRHGFFYFDENAATRHTNAMVH